MIEIIIFGLIMLIIGVICLIMDERYWAFLSGTIGAYLLSGGIMIYQESHKPKAIDVYRNKTTLEITYRDGVPVDSVVVFKDKEK